MKLQNARYECKKVKQSQTCTHENQGNGPGLGFVAFAYMEKKVQARFGIADKHTLHKLNYFATSTSIGVADR